MGNPVLILQSMLMRYEINMPHVNEKPSICPLGNCNFDSIRRSCIVVILIIYIINDEIPHTVSIYTTISRWGETETVPETCTHSGRKGKIPDQR